MQTPIYGLYRWNHARLGMIVETAIIGGSGLYDLEGIQDVQNIDITTPYGEPSDSVTVGNLDGGSVAFLPRHGRGHKINPTQVPYRANIFALKTLGVKRIISVSAVGSLVEELPPRSLVIPDQVIDRTRQRRSTFFEDGIVAHVSLADPFCSNLSDLIYENVEGLDINSQKDATWVVMEGPAFSTRAESFLYKSWGAHIIGMTALPEAKLAREAEICYSAMAWVTDYDCWREDEEDVSVDIVIQNLQHNVSVSKEILAKVIKQTGKVEHCPCNDALQFAIISDTAQISVENRNKLRPLLAKYLD